MYLRFKNMSIIEEIKDEEGKLHENKLIAQHFTNY